MRDWVHKNFCEPLNFLNQQEIESVTAKSHLNKIIFKGFGNGLDLPKTDRPIRDANIQLEVLLSLETTHTLYQEDAILRRIAMKYGT